MAECTADFHRAFILLSFGAATSRGFLRQATGRIKCIRGRISAEWGSPELIYTSRDVNLPRQYPRYRILLPTDQASRAEMVNAVSLEADLKVAVQKLWGAIKDSRNLLPKVLPSHYKSVEVIEGDGNSVGSVVLIKYGEGFPGLTFAKEKIEFVDEASMIKTYSVVDGEILKAYKTFKPSLKITEGADANSSVIKWSVAFEPASAEAPPPEFLKQNAFNTFKALEGYLLSANSAA